MGKVFEIRKAGFVNKGAAMMLITVIQKLGETVPGARWAVAPDYTTEYPDRAKYGLWHRAEMRRLGVDLGQILKLVPQRIRQRYGFVTDNEVDIILDAAGFAYSDQWNVAHTQELAKHAVEWTKNGKKLILLPQAFGPFSTSEIRDAMTTVCNHALLIFARDAVSLQHLTDLVGPQDHIKLAPDFTNLLDHSAAKGNGDVSKRGVAIVPNARMIDKNKGAASNNYVPMIIACIKILQHAGKEPFFLIHEGKQDHDLATKINERLEKPLAIEFPSDALEAKSIISRCDAILGSRYHALVSALSQGVPAIGTSWSHKYEMLFEDYGCGESLINPETEKTELKKTLAVIINDDARQQRAEELTVAARTIKDNALAMWDDVLQVVNT